MSKLVFYPEDTERGFYWNHVFFHGQAITHGNGDLVRANLELNDSIRDGVHLSKLRGEMGLQTVQLFLWTHPVKLYPSDDIVQRRKGLIVLIDDHRALDVAQKKMTAKAESL